MFQATDLQNFSLMNGGVFNVNHRGMIYTERKKSKKIKYLKTLSGDKYILYGNAQNNKMECIGDKECIMYGHYGNDEFYQKYKNSVFTIQDFKDNNGDGDKIFLRSDISGLKTKKGKANTVDLVIMGGGDKNPIPYGIITLNGPSLEEVEGWVKSAKSNLKNEDKIATPIIINNK